MFLSALKEARDEVEDVRGRTAGSPEGSGKPPPPESPRGAEAEASLIDSFAPDVDGSTNGFA